MTYKPDLSGRIAQTVRGRVLQWQYPPAFRLTEEALCAEFGVSRSPVRAALHMLLADGFLERANARGYRVKQLDLRATKELYELRMALELFVIEKLCRTGVTSDFMQQLRTACIEHAAVGPTKEDLAAWDREFHETLALSAGNRVVAERISEINDRISMLRIMDFRKTDRRVESCKQHLRILDRLEHRDVDGARREMAAHLGWALQGVEDAVKEVLAKSYGMSADQQICA